MKRRAASTVRHALAQARVRLDRAERALDELEAEANLVASVAAALVGGATWNDCAKLYGLPATRHGAEAARVRFYRWVVRK